MVKDRFGKKLWISAGIIVFSVVIALFALNFFAGDLAAQADSIVSDRAKIQEQNDAVANLAELEQQAPQAEQYQSAINQIIPDQYGLVNFVSWFASQGKQYGLTATASFQGDMVQPQGSTPGTAPFIFSLDGPLANITSFLDTLSSKSSGFLLSFNTFDMTPDGTNEKLTGQGTVFFR